MFHPAFLARRASFLALFAIVCWCDATTRAEENDVGVELFEKEVRPLLVEHCFKCHGEKQQKGGLRLDSLASAMAGGESGPAVVPQQPAESLLVDAINHNGFEMPPDGKLSSAQIATFTRWIELGAPWPGSEPGGPVKRKSKEFTADDRAWWAIQPLRTVTPPSAGEGWARNGIDHFIAESHAANQLTPAPEASKRSLLRRVYFDLIGLPPSPEEVESFVRDNSADAYEKEVDKLLHSPRYGERWARHWLDLVRYADSDGYRLDAYRENAWRYRDYVISALNSDKPYDRFIQEQLAGDELFPGDPEALVATGYLRQGVYEYNNRDARGQWSLMLNDITDTTADVFMGLGLQCARCHDHKFDPLLQRDYYRLQAVFAPWMPLDDQIVATAEQKAKYVEQMAQWEAKTADIRRQIAEMEHPHRERLAKEAIEKFPGDIQAMIRKPRDERTPLEHQVAELAYRQVTYEFERIEGRFKGDAKEKFLALKRELSAFAADRPAPLPTASVASDVGPISPPTPFPKPPRDDVAPGVISLLDPQPAPIEPLANSSGRRAWLAKWLTRSDNPLTARVMVNRVWQYHFGIGLAANASDFGRLGQPPTHPELLDWLATTFQREGWSLKRLHRLIVTSATYRQASRHPQFATLRNIDPENRFLWRANTRRLDAEQIRDAMLKVTGLLNLKLGGPGVNGGVPRRSIYLRVMRNARDPLLDVFDLPQYFTSESSRNTTTTPVQSLLLINNPQLLRFGTKFAERCVKESGNQDPVDTAWRLAFGRSLTETERTQTREYLASFQNVQQAGPARQREYVVGKLPYRDGQALLFGPAGLSEYLAVPRQDMLEPGDFTIEAFIQPRSIYENSNVRTIAAKWNGANQQAGWQFGVTGKGSRRKPQTLVLQMHGTKRDGSFGEAAIFSDHHIELNKPYFLAVAVRLATAESPGNAKFFVKDLSNDDEPLLAADLPHEIVGGLGNQEPLTIGGRRSALFDGLIDDVRLSRGALDAGGLLFTAEKTTAATIGYWQFEVDPGVLRDSSPHGLNISDRADRSQEQDERQSALIDLCHALLNSNEFLYVD